MSKPVLPEGYVARFEHQRWVVMESVVLLPDGSERSFYSQPDLMNRHEWTTWRDQHPANEAHVLPYGGKTLCRLYEKGEDGLDELVVFSAVECSPSDNYNKTIGRNIALGVALKAIERKQQTVGAKSEPLIIT